MWTGDVVEDRFVIERPIGSGGMGSVFLATDREGGQKVALKVLELATDGAIERFRREARVLSELSHPGIVRYVAHGETRARQPFLAMEYLEGEDLGKRLARGGVSVEESLSIARRTGEALAFAHAHGVVHRDVKPSNLFLVHRDVNRVKVLDFGIARPSDRSYALTMTGAMLGTIGYMAPEQTMGSRDVDARADVFSLGCVLFECLTGEAAFAGQHLVAVLAKVLAAEPPRASTARPALGGGFDALLRRMLAKDPEDRFPDASSVVEAIAELSPLVESIAPASTGPSSTAKLTDSERKVVTVILGEPRSSKTAATRAPGDARREFNRVRELSAGLGADARELAGGAFVIVLPGGSVATDQAAQAASLALALDGLGLQYRIVLATGASDATGAIPVPIPIGPVIDRAATLLRSPITVQDAAPHPVIIDTVTAGLLGSRFVVNVEQDVHVLSDERADSEAPRLLLGKATSCVGRDKELGLLDLTLREVVDERVARAILVTAPPGVGKSRLMSEFVARTRSARRARVLVGRARAVASSSPLGLAGQLVRRAAGLSETEAAGALRARLAQYASEIFGPSSVETLVEFLGELAGNASSNPPSPMLVAARNDPTVMREQKRRAFEAWISAESSVNPLLIVLEDLHWADAATVSYLSDALRQHADCPILIAAFARPEAHDLFPQSFSDLQQIRLSGLAPRAAERLVRATLGVTVGDDVVTRLVDRADGNAFYLEELIRRVAEGDESLPETVLAMVQSRLERLEPEARRVLRAVSVFGETAWTGGVASMLDEPIGPSEWLETLSDREILVRCRTSRFRGEREFVFRHSLLRDAAYAMLTDEDRVAAHRAAGDWLEAKGERDAAILADHFERGHARERALPWLVLAARTALEADALETALAFSIRGMDLGAKEEDRGVLMVIRANATARTTADYPTSELLREALGLLPTGSLYWWSAISGLIWSAAAVGRPEEALPFVQLAFATRPTELSGLYGEAVFGLVTGLFSVGQVDLARTFLERFDASLSTDPGLDPVFVAWIDAARAELAYNLPYRGPFRLENALLWGRSAASTMAQAGKASGEIVALIHLGYAAVILGAYDEAEAALTRSIAVATHIGSRFVKHYAEVFLGMLETRRGHYVEARRLLDPIHDSLDPTVAHLSRAGSAEAHFREGSFELALPLARAAAHGPAPRARRWGGCLVAEICLAQGSLEAALSAADRALGEPMLLSPEGERALLVARANTLRALGRKGDALLAMREARDLVVSVAADIEDAELKRGFLSGVEANAQAVALYEEWLLEVPS